jgi:uncharacterized protein YfaP (DUF2135 family)
MATRKKASKKEAPAAPGAPARVVNGPPAIEITSPKPAAQVTSPLAIVCVRFENIVEPTVTIRVNGVVHVVEIPQASGSLRENVTLIEGKNRIEVVAGQARQALELDLPQSGNIKLPNVKAEFGLRAMEVAGTFEGVSCPAGVIAVNGFMQQFAVTGKDGTFAEKVVLRNGDNHLAVQIGEHYTTRLIRGTFAASKLLVTLVWDTNTTDVDLYVSEAGGHTVYYSSKSGEGNLDVDRTSGYGPENYSVGAAGRAITAGRYVVRVHYYGDRGLGRTEWTTRIISDEGTPAQQRRTYYGILDRSDSGNASPGDRGSDWNDVAVAVVDAKGNVRFE